AEQAQAEQAQAESAEIEVPEGELPPLPPSNPEDRRNPTPEELERVRAWILWKEPTMRPPIVLGLSRSIGPWMVGGVYWSGYWRETYTVISLEIDNGGSFKVGVYWHGDAEIANPQPPRQTYHMTPWATGARGDKVVSMPAEGSEYIVPEPEEP